MGRFLPPDHSKGDETTVGGYQAVHERPAAFEGSDGASYSIEIDADRTDARGEWGAFLVFVRWSGGDPRVLGHIETDFLVRDASESGARAKLGAMPLAEAKRILDAEIASRGSAR